MAGACAQVTVAARWGRSYGWLSDGSDAVLDVLLEVLVHGPRVHPPGRDVIWKPWVIREKPLPPLLIRWAGFGHIPMEFCWS